MSQAGEQITYISRLIYWSVWVCQKHREIMNSRIFAQSRQKRGVEGRTVHNIPLKIASNILGDLLRAAKKYGLKSFWPQSALRRLRKISKFSMVSAASLPNSHSLFVLSIAQIFSAF
jgi:hypothetical protein